MHRVGRSTIVVIVALLVLAVLAIGCFAYYQRATAHQQIVMMPELPPSPTPSPIPKVGSISHISSDGTMVATIKTTESTGLLTKYEIFANQTDSETEPIAIFDGTIDSNTRLSLPFNSWSPDNAEFFVEKKTDGAGTEYLVFKASGDEFANGPFIEVSTHFTEAELAYDLNQVTGWAAPNLLMVTTTNPEDGSQGPAYWFDITSLRFIRLSTQF